MVSPNKYKLWFIKRVRLLIDYFLAGRLFLNAIKIKRNLKFTDDYDLLISLSTPFMNHLAISYVKKSFPNSKTLFVADSGDPFYRSQQTKRAPYFYFLEKYIYKQFDFLTVPAEASIEAYKGLIKYNKIKIIPQGFNLENIKLAERPHNELVTFAYSGVFYLDIRNLSFYLINYFN